MPNACTWTSRQAPSALRFVGRGTLRWLLPTINRAFREDQSQSNAPSDGGRAAAVPACASGGRGGCGQCVTATQARATGAAKPLRSAKATLSGIQPPPENGARSMPTAQSGGAGSRRRRWLRRGLPAGAPSTCAAIVLPRLAAVPQRLRDAWRRNARVRRRQMKGICDVSDNETRWLDADGAARYLSLRVDAFLRAVAAGRIPKPSRHLGERTPRWDRSALDSVMIGGTASTDTRTAFDALAEKIKAEGRKGRASQAA